MPNTMRAAVLDAPNRMSVRTVAYPAPRPTEVTIAVRACGICGTDQHLYHGEFSAVYPLIPGHEFSGVIAEVGTEVRNWHVGDRVTADPNIACGDCYFCRNGQTNQCLNHQAIGVTRDGAFAEFVAVPARNVYSIGDGLALDEAAMVEPLSCVVYGLRRLRLRLGDQVLIFGAGPIGLLLMQGCNRGGASAVTIVDLQANRLATASVLGVTHTVVADSKEAGILKTIAPYGFDAVIDATGVPTVVERCLDYVKSGGKLLLFGVCPQDARISMSPFAVCRHDVEIIGAFAVRYSFDSALTLVQSNTIHVKPLIHPRLSLEEVPSVFEASQPSKDSLKAVIVIP